MKDGSTKNDAIDIQLFIKFLMIKIFNDLCFYEIINYKKIIENINAYMKKNEIEKYEKAFYCLFGKIKSELLKKENDEKIKYNENENTPLINNINDIKIKKRKNNIIDNPYNWRIITALNLNVNKKIII